MKIRVLRILTLITILLVLSGCSGGYNEVTLARGFVITPEWNQITPERPLVVERELQYIRISVKGSFDAFSANGIKLPDGRIANLEIKLVSGGSDPQTYQLVHKGGDRQAIGGEFANYGTPNPLPKGTVVEKILLRSDTSIPTNQIRWADFNWEDVYK